MEEACAVLLLKDDKQEGKPQFFGEILFRPVISWVWDNCQRAGLEEICVVANRESDLLREVLPLEAQWMDMEIFVQQHLEQQILILHGDIPFLTAEIIQEAYQHHKAKSSKATVIMASAQESVLACWVQAGILAEAINKGVLSSSQQILTNLLSFIKNQNFKVEVVITKDSKMGFCATSYQDLAYLNQLAREMVFARLYSQDIDIPITDGVIISAESQIGSGTQILPGTILRGICKIGKNCIIGPGSVLQDAVIGDGCIVRNTYITSSTLEEQVQIGPFSQVRPNCHIGRGVKIGDFVEIKNSIIGEDTHAAHLTYIGDADCGKRVNFGCGVAIANYNGKEKFRTTIGDDCFIGCGTNLVSPVRLGDGAYTASGSTVTRDVPPDTLCIARSREVYKEGMALQYRKLEKP